MKNFAKLLTTALMIGCLAAGIAGCGGRVSLLPKAKT